MNNQTDTNRVVNPLPKARFQTSPDNITKHRDLVDRNEFQRGCDFALLEYQAELCDKENNPTVVGLKIAGAQEFLKVFRLLSEKAQLKPIPRPNDNLTPQ
jgi:hypothetical protein